MSAPSTTSKFGAGDRQNLNSDSFERRVRIVIAIISHDHTGTQGQHIIAVIPLFSGALFLRVATGWDDL
jgi:hypothetical protein